MHRDHEAHRRAVGMAAIGELRRRRPWRRHARLEGEAAEQRLVVRLLADRRAAGVGGRHRAVDLALHADAFDLP
ncbi:hypothetical protein GXW74_21225 [Roseomonas eburnea]|uniref:Uncharacterized protein n=1 Tax=Neoroseomonas eburnea TaxID=1346889 RepID=A0A9X9XH42_9PROT|nr:hypothetical protein [Neoroseomonas eburnea]MBR0683028.1 hypothetical protein [Neoroseomonas eburnea]